MKTSKPLIYRERENPRCTVSWKMVAIVSNAPVPYTNGRASQIIDARKSGELLSLYDCTPGAMQNFLSHLHRFEDRCNDKEILSILNISRVNA